MKVNELRIGNLIDVINRSSEVHLPMGGCFRVISIGTSGVECVPNDMDDLQILPENIIKVKVVNLCGIRITGDVLIKMGFQNKGIFANKTALQGNPSNDFDGAIKYALPSDKEYDKIIVYYVTEGFFKLKFFYHLYEHTDDYGDSIDAKEVTYAHQLQNLHFVMEGEELEIK